MFFSKKSSNNSEFNFNYLYNQWIVLLNKYKFILVDKKDYEWMGECNMKVIQYATQKQIEKYSALLKLATEEHPKNGINYGIFFSVNKQFKSLLMFNKSWYK
jgi:hypothetical protein